MSIVARTHRDQLVQFTQDQGEKLVEIEVCEGDRDDLKLTRLQTRAHSGEQARASDAAWTDHDLNTSAVENAHQELVIGRFELGAFEQAVQLCAD